MLTRIVIMDFHEENVPEFLELFRSVRSKIISFNGCQSLALKRFTDNPGKIVTISEWESEGDLNRYRNSELFSETWDRTKALFSSKAQAFSLIDVQL